MGDELISRRDMATELMRLKKANDTLPKTEFRDAYDDALLDVLDVVTKPRVIPTIITMEEVAELRYSSVEETCGNCRGLRAAHIEGNNVVHGRMGIWCPVDNMEWNPE